MPPSIAHSNTGYGGIASRCTQYDKPGAIGIEICLVLAKFS